ncbi:universal stress family protein [Burkholderia mallei NCTC 10247]|nr:universal stress family protein [Burkholderia mallei NCTC 10247]
MFSAPRTIRCNGKRIRCAKRFSEARGNAAEPGRRNDIDLNQEVGMYQKIMVALDGSDISKRGLAEAIKIAKATRGRVHAVYVVDKSVVFSYAGHFDPNALLEGFRDDGRKALAEAEQALAAAQVPGDAELFETAGIGEEVAQALERCAKSNGADLVVLGTHGRRGVRRVVLGSVAERFLRASHCPVLLVRGDEAEHQVQV